MGNKNVLVGVLKSKDDLGILLKHRWYRIPAAHLPERKFKYLAFYQPASFGKNGKRIAYYARVLRKKTVKRIKLLPKEPGHPRANDDYLKIEFSKIIKLTPAVKNIVPRRITFGFTDLKTLHSAGNILELYGVSPTEQIVEKQLKKNGIKTVKEFCVSKNGRRYRIDLAIFSKNGKVAVECDNLKAHGTKKQIRKDKIKDSFLRRNGWRVVRLKERDIIERIDRCIKKITKAMQTALV
jgi:very-short-patch-repair endonuclease